MMKRILFFLITAAALIAFTILPAQAEEQVHQSRHEDGKDTGPEGEGVGGSFRAGTGHHALQDAQDAVAKEGQARKQHPLLLIPVLHGTCCRSIIPGTQRQQRQDEQDTQALEDGHLLTPELNCSAGAGVRTLEAVSTAVVHIYGAYAAFFIVVDKFASGAGFYAKTAFFKAKALGGVYTQLLFGRNGFRV